MKLCFSSDGWDDYQFWQKTDAKVLRNINDLIKECLRTPFSGTGQPEALRNKHCGDDVWHLPGKIPISHVRALREMKRGADGELFARSMVRGHWRRAAEAQIKHRSINSSSRNTA